MTEFKDIKLGQKEEIVLNGNKYHIEYRLTAERHRHLRTELIKVQFGEEYDLAKILSNAKSAYNDFNNSKVADGTVKLYNIIRHAETYELTEDPALRACAIFLMREGEDVTKISEELIKEKVEDFKSEPIARESFLELAFSIQNGLKGN